MMNKYTLKPCIGPCPPAGFEHDPCNLHFIISFSWPGGTLDSDLDTGVFANLDTSGFACANNANPFFTSSDQISGENLVEIHHVSVNLGSIQGDNFKLIELFMHWHAGVPQPNQPVDITVQEGGREEILPGVLTNTFGNGCSVFVGQKQAKIKVPADGNWILTKFDPDGSDI
jgi:hypothetical protein